MPYAADWQCLTSLVQETNTAMQKAKDEAAAAPAEAEAAAAAPAAGNATAAVEPVG